MKIIKELEKTFRDLDLHRPMQVERFEEGTEIAYDVRGINPDNEGKAHLVIEKFVGGGFAGQVYRVKVLDIETNGGQIGGLEVGNSYAMKILIPPTGFSRLFRNALYWIGFQGPFQLQVNPAAARSGALWQKLIRRGAKIRFGDEKTVVDIHATFVDSHMGSCGELSEWVEGRTWRLEVDEHLDLLGRWAKGKKVNPAKLGSPEYRAKREFMKKFVDLLYEMGGYEFARQYEWSTCKSQPNCLKRQETEKSPAEGLVAVDFRAGLALLPLLPMSPGDVKLIGKGVLRGSLVQFDRGDVKKLERMVEENKTEFGDMGQVLAELQSNERVYRESIPDITHNHIRLFYSSRLWSTMHNSFVTGWKIRNLIDEQTEQRLRNSRILALVFYLLGVFPLIGRFVRRIWGQAHWRKHYGQMLKSWQYLGRAVRGKVVEKVISWHRAGRIDEKRSGKIVSQPWRSLYHLPLSLLPVGIHRSMTDWQYFKDRLAHLVVRPVRLYFNAELREQWLLEMVTEGKKKHLLTDDDARIIQSQIGEPFIQKYLKSLAVHLCTLPVSEVVLVSLAIIYLALHPEMPRSQAYAIALGILALFQVVPVSPGSLVRGLYVVYLVIRERNFKDYNIAVFLGFLKIIGYLAFPIQMAYRYPALARFMAGHWATEAVHIVPVFGESGALLEHGVFNLFYNWPLTIRRRMRKRAELRASLKPRYWHIIIITLAGTAIFGMAESMYFRQLGVPPGLKDIWVFTVLVPLLCGSAATLGAGGAALLKRIIGGAVCGLALGVLYTFLSVILSESGLSGINEIATSGLWRVFIFALVSTLGVILTEIRLPDPTADQ